MHLEPTNLPPGGPAADEYVFLIGRPPLQEFLDFVTSRTEGGESANLGALVAEWTTANDRVLELERTEAGAADSPSIQSLPTELNALRDRVLADPIFQRSYSLVPTTIRMVNLNELVVFQKQVNLEYVQRLQATLGPSPTVEDVFRMCLPFDHPQPAFSAGRLANNAFQFQSASTDFRPVGVQLLRPNQVTGFVASGPIAGIVGIAIGFGPNFLQAIHAENRLILNNASHRAYALRDLGIYEVPCVVQEVSRREELKVIGHDELKNSPDLYLTDPRPPMLRDYFDPALRKLLPVTRRRRQYRVLFQIEPLDVPST